MDIWPRILAHYGIICNLCYDQGMPKKWKKLLGALGPGVITGAADDDPSGIATYSQTGAQFGYGQLWTALYMLPFQTAVQEAAARIGAVTGKGIVAVARGLWGKQVVWFLVALVLIANTINIGADIGAMAAALQLVTPFSFIQLTLSTTALILVLEIFTSYRVYARILKWLALTLFAYPLTVFFIKAPWDKLLAFTVLPHFELTPAFFFIITGVLGTTISPYMFFWQAGEEVEEEKMRHLKVSKPFISRLRFDNFVGMFFSEIGTWAMIVVSATVLFSHGITDIRTAADAAKALEPLVTSFPNSGYLAKLLFSVGIVGLGLLSIPVLSGSAAYATAEAFKMHEGLNLKLRQAHGFYGVITIATVVGLLINFVGIDPMKALVYTAVINGVVAVPLIFFIAKIAENKKIMGSYTSGLLSKLLVWATFFGMGASALAMIFMLK